MSLDDFQNEVWDLRWSAEISSRYHRKHAAWLSSVDFYLNLMQVISATAVFVELMHGVPSVIAKIGTAIVGILGLVQVLSRMNKSAIDHELLMKRWCDLLIEIDTIDPTVKQVTVWKRTKGELNQLVVNELRAVFALAENEAATALGVLGRQRKLSLFERLFMHIFAFHRTFPSAPDVSLAAPSNH